MQKRKPAVIIILVVCAAWIGLLIYNVMNNKDFLVVSSGTLLQTGIVVMVSYFLVQYRSDVKQRLQLSQDFLNKLVVAYGEFQKNVSIWITAPITDASEKKNIWQQVNLYGRRVSNYLGFLKKMPLSKGDKEILQNIEKEWDALRAKCTDAVDGDPEKVEISRQLERFRLSLEEKTDNLMMNLYI